MIKKKGVQMRKIKFRGLDADGKWIYGDLINGYLDGIFFIFPEDAIFVEESVWVHPETVGQFTGLFDCKGKEIYEGDILNNLSIVEFGLVGYENQFLGFYKHSVENGHEKYSPLSSSVKDSTITGNIHEKKGGSNDVNSRDRKTIFNKRL